MGGCGWCLVDCGPCLLRCPDCIRCCTRRAVRCAQCLRCCTPCVRGCGSCGPRMHPCKRSLRPCILRCDSLKHSNQPIVRPRRSLRGNSHPQPASVPTSAPESQTGQWQSGRFPVSQRDCIIQPGVARDELRRVRSGRGINPERVESLRLFHHPRPMSQSLAKILLHVVFSTKDRRPLLRDPHLSRGNASLHGRHSERDRLPSGYRARRGGSCAYSLRPVAHLRACGVDWKWRARKAERAGGLPLPSTGRGPGCTAIEIRISC